MFSTGDRRKKKRYERETCLGWKCNIRISGLGRRPRGSVLTRTSDGPRKRELGKGKVYNILALGIERLRVGRERI